MPFSPAGARPAGGGHAAALLPGARPAAPGDLPPRMRPIYYVWAASVTMASRAKIKPQVDGLRFSRNAGYGRGAGAKRSRWAGSVAAASRAADRGRPEVS